MTALGKYPRRNNTGIGKEVLQDARTNVILKKKQPEHTNLSIKGSKFINSLLTRWWRRKNFKSE